MKMDELKRGFWGYKKDSVYRYIVSLEEDASARVAEKEARLEKLEAESKQRIESLESALSALREENASLRNNQAVVFSTLMEAQKHAEHIRAESKRRERQAQEEIAVSVQRKTKQLDSYLEQIQMFRETVQAMLLEFEERAEEVERSLTQLRSQAPSVDLDGDAQSAAAAPNAGKRAAFQRRMEQEPQEEESWKNISFI